MKAKNPPEPSNVDPTPIPVRWIPELTIEEAGEFATALAKDPAARPTDFCRDELRKAVCPLPIPMVGKAENYTKEVLPTQKGI